MGINGQAEGPVVEVFLKSNLAILKIQMVHILNDNFTSKNHITYVFTQLYKDMCKKIQS